jgi:hypothetical protein
VYLDIPVPTHSTTASHKLPTPQQLCAAATCTLHCPARPSFSSTYSYDVPARTCTLQQVIDEAFVREGLIQLEPQADDEGGIKYSYIACYVNVRACLVASPGHAAVGLPSWSYPVLLLCIALVMAPCVCSVRLQVRLEGAVTPQNNTIHRAALHLYFNRQSRKSVKVLQTCTSLAESGHGAVDA